MNVYILGGILAGLPAVSVWISYPRRRWAAWLAAGAAMLLWGAGFGVLPESDRALWTALGAWSLFGGFYAAYVVGRNVREYRRLDIMIRERTELQGRLEKSVAEARAKGAHTDFQQKEGMALYGMVKGLSEALNWDEVRPKLEAAAQNYLGLEEFSLYVADLRAANTLHPLVARRLGESVGASWDTLSRYLQEHRVSLNDPHIMQSPERAVMVPIRESNELMGYFFARLPNGADPKVLLAKAQTFAAEIAFAFRRVKLFQEMERLSQLDGLTGVYRRGWLDARLKEEAVRARTFKTTFCVLLMDVDHFKKLNDTYGHQFGDQVLKRVGEILKANVYETDFVARYGGEEFCVLLPRADPVGVIRKANGIRTAIEREPFQLAMKTVKVTISIGVAHFPRDGDSPEAVVHQADQALYHAKESGRNRVMDYADVPAAK